MYKIKTSTLWYFSGICMLIGGILSNNNINFSLAFVLIIIANMQKEEERKQILKLKKEQDEMLQKSSNLENLQEEDK